MYTARADGDFGLEEYSEHETLIDAKRAANAMFDDNLHSPRVEDASGSVVYYPWNELRYHKPERACFGLWC